MISIRNNKALELCNKLCDADKARARMHIAVYGVVYIERVLPKDTYVLCDPDVMEFAAWRHWLEEEE